MGNLAEWLTRLTRMSVPRGWWRSISFGSACSNHAVVEPFDLAPLQRSGPFRRGKQGFGEVKEAGEYGVAVPRTGGTNSRF